MDRVEIYFRKLRGMKKKISHPPRHEPGLWKHYDSVLDRTARTNNLSEGWHNRFQVVVVVVGNSSLVFFDELGKEREDTEIMLRRVQ